MPTIVLEHYDARRPIRAQDVLISIFGRALSPFRANTRPEPYRWKLLLKNYNAVFLDLQPADVNIKNFKKPSTLPR